MIGERSPLSNGEYRVPFGPYEGLQLADVPRSHVEWLARKCHSPSVQRAARRFLGIPEPDAPPKPCSRCKSPDPPDLRWQRFADDTVHIRATCRKCGHVSYAAQTAANVATANANRPFEKLGGAA